MEQKPLVSVVIPNFNYSNYLEECIQSVFNQDYANIETIVVDDGSVDNSMNILEKYRNEITSIVQVNQGVSRARNIGFLHSHGAYICFLDADDTIEPTKISEQVRLIKSSRVDLVYCGVNLCNERLEVQEIRTPTYNGYCYDLFFRYPTRAVIPLGSGSPLISADLVRKVGGFDSSLKTSADWDFMRRLSRETNIDFVKLPLVNYRIHSRSMSSQSLSSYYFDNSLAVIKMLKESSLTYKRPFMYYVNIRAWTRFNLGAARHLLRTKCYLESVRYIFKLIQLRHVFTSRF